MDFKSPRVLFHVSAYHYCVVCDSRQMQGVQQSEPTLRMPRRTDQAKTSHAAVLVPPWSRGRRGQPQR